MTSKETSKKECGQSEIIIPSVRIFSFFIVSTGECLANVLDAAAGAIRLSCRADGSTVEHDTMAEI